MSEDFSIDFDLDEPRARLIVKVKGVMRSAEYTEKCLANYGALVRPSQIDRLIDLTEASGYVNFDDLKKLSDLWDRLLSGADRVVRVAVVTKHALINARMGMVDLLSAKEEHQAFATLEDAHAWLDERFQ